MIHRTHKTLLGSTGASFSDCERYRYTLYRSWGVGDYLGWIMLNPSRADHRDNDATIERCERRAKSLGYGGIIVTNLFAFRATYPADMLAAEDPIGEGNDEAIWESASQSKLVICGWGTDGGHLNRSAAVLAMLRGKCPHKLHALKFCKNGEPGHPLFLPYGLEPQPWK